MGEQLTREDFVLGSGLIDDFDGTVVSAIFGQPPADYIAKATISGDEIPAWVYLTIQPVGENADMQAIEQGYGCGKGNKWIISDDGKSVESEKSPDKKVYNKNSRAGQLVAAMMTAAGNGNLVAGQEFFLARGTPMTNSDFFVGMTFHWSRKTMVTSIDGKSQSTDVLLPAAFISAGKPSAKVGSKQGSPKVK